MKRSAPRFCWRRAEAAEGLHLGKVGAMKEQIELYVKKVKDVHELCRDEQATKASLIAPLFGILGYDMTDPRECIPEYRADFGKGEKASTPVDWAFALNGDFVFIVEAKAAAKKLKPYAEQLGMYFVKAAVNLGIYSNGVQWQFYSDVDKANIMDKEPFLTWNILKDDPLPLDFLTILHKSHFQPAIIRTFAEYGRRQSLLVDELTRLLEPSSDFVKLAVRNIETRALHSSVVEEWRPILVNAIHEWAKQKTLSVALARPADNESENGTDENEGVETAHRTTLADVINAGILKPPLKLFADFKGTKLEATLETDGKVTFQGESCTTCSAAGALAKKSITGQLMSTGGWTFWQYDDANGEIRTLDDARDQFLRKSGKTRDI